MKKRFLVTRDFRSPFMVITGMAHKPHDIRFKAFKKGDTVMGEMFYKNGQPAYVMVDKTLIFPLECISEIVTKQDVVSNAVGDEKKQLQASLKKPEGPIQYVDWAILGAVAGFLAVHFGEKKAWIKPDPKNKFIGMAIGAGLFAYAKFRIAPAIVKKQTAATK